MNKKLWIIGLAVVVIGVAAYASGMFGKGGAPSQTPATGFDPANATYIVEGKSVTLVNGRAETSVAPGSATKVTTSIFGQTVSGDLNADGKPDAALVLVQNPGGSGTFYYIAAAINATNGAQGTNAILLGDRIAPQTIQISNGKIVANYATRKLGEPMTAIPSVGVSKYFIFDGTQLKEAPSVVGQGEHCGGNMMNAPVCAAGYHCAPSPMAHAPFGDIGGICVAN